jgi:branched-chain amino acid transport system substrate-binding protein
MKLRSPALLWIVGVALTTCQSGVGSPTPSSARADIVIASDLPTSGYPGTFNLPLQHAIQLAIDQHPTIAGFKLGYLAQDDALAGISMPEKGIQNIERMIADPRVLAMVGPYQSNVAFAEIPPANEAHLAMVSPSNTNLCLTRAAVPCNPQPAELRAGGPNNYFRTAAPDPVQGRAMARFASRTLKVKRVAAFTEYGAFEALTVASFEDEFVRDGGQLVLQQNLAPGTTDFTPFLAEARSRGAEAIYAATQYDVCSARFQMKGVFPNASYFLGMDGITVWSDCISKAGDNSEGMYASVSDVDATRSSDPSTKKVVEAYGRAYGAASLDVRYTFAAYDCTLILISAISQAVSANGGRIPTRQQVVDVLDHSHFTGVTGSYSFDSNGDALSPLMAIYAVQGGKWTYLQQIDASAPTIAG